MDKLFDRYTIQARLYPASIVVFPFTFLGIATLEEGEIVDAGFALLAGAGVLLFLANYVRSQGRSVEKYELKKAWDELPTTYMLRTSHSGNEYQRDRWRMRLEELTGAPLPSSSDESMSPQESNRRYHSAVRYLTARVHVSAGRYPKVQDENINYGFRRNLYSLKRLAMVAVSISAVLSVIFCISDLISAYQFCWLVGVQSAAFWAWLKIVNIAWVQDSAESYAGKLFETLDDAAIFGPPKNHQ